MIHNNVSKEKVRKILEDDEKLVNDIENAQIVEEDWQKGQFILEDISSLDTSTTAGNGTTTSGLSIFDFKTTDQLFENLERDDKEALRSLSESI